MPGVYFANMPRSLPLLALYISAWSSACFSCSCIWSGPPCQAAWQVSAVFLGTVEQLKSDTPEPTGNGAIPVNGFLGTHATFRVAEAFLGMNGRGNTVEARTGMGGDCGFPFKLGATYVVYANASEAGPLIASICSGTKSLKPTLRICVTCSSLSLRSATSSALSGTGTVGGASTRPSEPMCPLGFQMRKSH